MKCWRGHTVYGPRWSELALAVIATVVVSCFCLQYVCDENKDDVERRSTQYTSIVFVSAVLLLTKLQ